MKKKNNKKHCVKKRDGKSSPLQSTFLGKQIQVQVLQAASSLRNNDKKITKKKTKRSSD